MHQKLLRDAIINGKETDTVVTKAFSGKLARGINNRFIEEMSNTKATSQIIQYKMS